MSIIPPIPTEPTGSPTITTRIWLDGYQSYTIAAGDVVYAETTDGTPAFQGYTDQGLPFINNGTIWSHGTDVLAANYFGSVTNNGIAVANGEGSQVEAFSFNTMQGLTNTGSIYAVTQNASAIGMWDYTTFDAPITNSGIIAAESDSSSAVFGIWRFNGGGQIHNLPGGEILAEGGAAEAIRFDRGLEFTNNDIPNPVAIDNEGLIEAVSENGQNYSFAIAATHLSSEAFDILNSGTIRADYAIYVSSPNDGAAWNSHETVTNLASGLIDGRVYLGGGDDLVVNAGTITGLVELGDGNDEYNGSASSTAVTVDGDAGDDIFHGGSGTNEFHGGDGNDYIVGGTGINQLNGDDGADILQGGAQGDHLDGGAGGDVLFGGGGADSLTGGAGADIFTYLSASDSTAAAPDTIQDFETGIDRIDLSALAPTSVSLSASNGMTVLTAQTASGTLTIDVIGAISLSDIVTLPQPTLTANDAGQALTAGVSGSNLIGGTGDDLLLGSPGNDRIDGGAGVDAMYGGAGNDTYMVDNIGDVVVEHPNEGTDTVFASINTYQLPDNVENLVLLTPATAWGNALDNVITGSSGDDAINGGGGHDIIIGGLGADNLGSVGSAVFVYQSVADSTPGAADTISNFQYEVDKIDLTQVPVTSISWTEKSYYLGGKYDDVTIQTTHGPMEIQITIPQFGNSQLSMSDFLVFHEPVANDVDGDGISDILWRNDNGNFTDWLGNNSGGYTPNAVDELTNVSTDWQIAGTGDFNGDGHADVLWRNADGRITDWLGNSNGSFTDNVANALNGVSNDWQIVGVGDFNHDGRSDILWRNTDGRITDWLGNSSGGFTPNADAFDKMVSTDWKVVAVGDFNGDGYSDILWRNSQGWITNWLGSAGGTFTDNKSNGYQDVSLDWHVAGIGDFNKDGISDILWRNDDGRITDWLGTASGGYQPNSANFYTSVGTDWQVAQVGDLNGDGYADILWRNSGGRMTNWLGTANGSFIDNVANGFDSVDTSWHITPESHNFF
jgi:Ca2+-binding RTX toxin-like protein